MPKEQLEGPGYERGIVVHPQVEQDPEEGFAACAVQVKDGAFLARGRRLKEVESCTYLLDWYCILHSIHHSPAAKDTFGLGADGLKVDALNVPPTPKKVKII